MKKEILFKGKIEHTNEWVEGYYFETPLTDEKTDSMPEDGWYFLTGKKRHVISRNSCVYQVSEKTVCEYTGTTDCNNIKIFEGDILKYDHITVKNKKNKFVVRWSEGHCGFVADSMKPDNIWPNLNPGTTRRLKVIGNIHDDA